MNFVVLFFSNILDTNHKHSSVTQKMTDISKRAFIISGIGLNSHLRNSLVCFVHEIRNGTMEQKSTLSDGYQIN